MVSGPNSSGAQLDQRRRKILFRCWHRGMREVDLLLGSFANEHLSSLSIVQLRALERLLDQPDQDIFAWICEQAEVDLDVDLELLSLIREFHQQNPLFG